MNQSQTTALDTTLFLNGTVEARNISNSYAMSAVSEFMNVDNRTKQQKMETINEKYNKLIPSNLSNEAEVNVQVFDNSTDPSLEADEVKFVSTAKIEEIGSRDETLTSKTEVISGSFDYGDYALFINDFDNKALWTTESVKGDVHVNGTIGIKGGIGESGPIIDGNLTTTEDPTYYGALSESNYAGFLGSTDFNSPEIEMPTFDISPATHPNMLNLDDYKMRYVEFRPDGSVLLSKAHGGRGKTKVISAYDMEHKYGGMIYGTGKGGPNSNNAVHVEGTVNGNYSVISPDKIYLTGNITYEPDPRDDPDSESMLSIMTHDDLLTDWRYGVNSGTRDSLLVMASIFTDGTFRAGDHAKPSDYGNLTVYGTRIQGLFEEVIDNKHQKWHQQIIYDDRLRNMRPPGFQFSGKLQILSWKDSI